MIIYAFILSVSNYTKHFHAKYETKLDCLECAEEVLTAAEACIVSRAWFQAQYM